jgi:hypothetical protein
MIALLNGRQPQARQGFDGRAGEFRRIKEKLIAMRLRGLIALFCSPSGSL